MRPVPRLIVFLGVIAFGVAFWSGIVVAAVKASQLVRGAK